MIDRNKALYILQSIHQNMYGEWIIPHYPQYCEKEVTLINGEKATAVWEDGVYDFLDYVKTLIENEEVV